MVPATLETEVADEVYRIADVHFEGNASATMRFLIKLALKQIETEPQILTYRPIP